MYDIYTYKHVWHIYIHSCITFTHLHVNPANAFPYLLPILVCSVLVNYSKGIASLWITIGHEFGKLDQHEMAGFEHAWVQADRKGLKSDMIR